MSSDYQWNREKAERSHEGLRQYDVQKAKELIFAKPRRVIEIDLQLHGQTFRDYLAGVKLRAEEEWVVNDRDFPIILIQQPDGKTPIDGRHRLAQALKDSRPTINAILLTPEESVAVRILGNTTQEKF